jgi:hypothetical protein
MKQVPVGITHHHKLFRTHQINNTWSRVLEELAAKGIRED